MRMLKQLIGQLWFNNGCPPDHQAAVAKDLAVALPHNNRRHHTVSILGVKDTCNNRSVCLYSRNLSTTFSHKVSMPGSVTDRPRSKMQALCFQIKGSM
jgi:hypothetical protein